MAVDESFLVAILDSDENADEKIEFVDVDASRPVDVEHVEDGVALTLRQIGDGVEECVELYVVERLIVMDVDHTEEVVDELDVATREEAVCAVQVHVLEQP